MSLKDPIARKAYFKKWRYSKEGQKYFEATRTKRNEQHTRYEKSKKGRLMSSLKAKRMREKYPEKWRARSQLRYAVRMGKINKLPCEKCGEIKVFAHHPDYSVPLKVVWLCLKHHREEHDNKH